MIRRIIPSVLVSVLGLFALGGATDGFRALTSEQARRLEALRLPKAPPPVVLEDQDGRRFALSDYANRVVLVDFTYTQCKALCRVAGAQLQALARSLAEEVPEPDVIFVTISFDPGRDTPQVLSAHARKLGADPARRRFARPADPAQLPSLLKAFGIVVLPDGKGDFQHNGAVHVLARDGRLSAIYDYEARDQILRDARTRL